MRTFPTLPYCGLTVVLSNPSRNDKEELLSDWAGKFFEYECLRPAGITRYSCDIRTSDTINERLLENTKGILLLGESAFQSWTDGTYKDYNLNEQRGHGLQTNYNIPTIASYTPRDCVDFKNHEGRLNPLVKSYNETKTLLKEAEETTKRKGDTAWSNYGFWLRQDTRKLVDKMLCRKVLSTPLPSYRIYANSTEVVAELRRHESTNLYLDIETDADYNITCFGFAFGSGDIYVVPTLRYNYRVGYSEISKILRALAKAMMCNTVVTHNSQFDLLILAWKYKLPCGPNHYDTMLTQHRCFPEAEISLGHCMSMWTWEPYHKDEGIFQPANIQQEKQLWAYNGKDIHGTRLVHLHQLHYAKTIPGLSGSIAQSNSCIRPYLINSLLGINYSEAARVEILKDNDRALTQMIRIFKVLMGDLAYERIRGKSDSNIGASSRMAVKYFHDELGYPVVKRSGKTKDPSLDADAMYKLKLKMSGELGVENPMMDLILAYRERAKESSMLRFEEWKI